MWWPWLPAVAAVVAVEAETDPKTDCLVWQGFLEPIMDWALAHQALDRIQPLALPLAVLVAVVTGLGLPALLASLALVAVVGPTMAKPLIQEPAPHQVG
jgi:hypothetical protein